MPTEVVKRCRKREGDSPTLVAIRFSDTASASASRVGRSCRTRFTRRSSAGGLRLRSNVPVTHGSTRAADSAAVSPSCWRHWRIVPDATGATSDCVCSAKAPPSSLSASTNAINTWVPRASTSCHASGCTTTAAAVVQRRERPVRKRSVPFQRHDELNRMMTVEIRPRAGAPHEQRRRPREGGPTQAARRREQHRAIVAWRGLPGSPGEHASSFKSRACIPC